MFLVLPFSTCSSVVWLNYTLSGMRATRTMYKNIYKHKHKHLQTPLHTICTALCCITRNTPFLLLLLLQVLHVLSTFGYHHNHHHHHHLESLSHRLSFGLRSSWKPSWPQKNVRVEHRRLSSPDPHHIGKDSKEGVCSVTLLFNSSFTLPSWSCRLPPRCLFIIPYYLYMHPP